MKILNAPDPMLESMWNQVIFLLGIKVTEADMNAHLDELAVLNEWVMITYGEKLTTREVVLAYNMACEGKLGIKELFSIISPKHVGIVLDAYLRYAQGDLEVNRVYAQQLLLDNDPNQSEEEIDAFMEWALEQATREVRDGKFYFDEGNGLFDWLHAKGRIVLDEDTSDAYYQKSVQALPKLLKRGLSILAEHETAKINDLTQLLRRAEAGRLGNDHEAWIQAHCKRLYLNDYLKKTHG